jgi:hypothetical protein
MSAFHPGADMAYPQSQVSFVPISLQKSATADGRPAISLGAAGFDPPAPTLSTQLLRYAIPSA